MVSEKLELLIKQTEAKGLDNLENIKILFELAKHIRQDDKEYSLILSNKVKNRSAKLSRTNALASELYWDAVLYRSNDFFEDYLLYMEKDRAPQKRFYLPRRNTLKTVVDDLQDLEDLEDWNIADH